MTRRNPRLKDFLLNSFVSPKNSLLDLAFSLEYYTEVMDLSYLLFLLNEDSFGSRYKALNKALCDLVEDFSLVGFYTLAIEVSRMCWAG